METVKHKDIVANQLCVKWTCTVHMTFEPIYKKVPFSWASDHGSNIKTSTQAKQRDSKTETVRCACGHLGDILTCSCSSEVASWEQATLEP